MPFARSAPRRAVCGLVTLGFLAVSALLTATARDAPLDGGHVIHAAQLRGLLARGGAVVIDVAEAPRRPPSLAPGAPWLPLPHRALPGALWIPGAGADVLAPSFERFFRRTLAAAVSTLDAPLVFYCHQRCRLSWNAANRAVTYGFRNVYWFPEGIEGWLEARGPTVMLSPLSDARLPPDAASDAKPADAGGSTQQALLLLDLELTGDLGGPAFAAEHTARLEGETVRLRSALARTQMFRIMDSGPAQALMDRLRSEQSYLHDCNGCDLEIGRELHADLVMVAWVNRVSGLILTLTYEIHDVRTAQIVARKSYDFRGDNDNAWSHAIDYMARDLRASGLTSRR